ncbi:MAG: hypothetical protein LBF90_06745 [Prevotellaceae bacterium]|nr:hypothetical protein [Prevotellaceae bacterium]
MKLLFSHAPSDAEPIDMKQVEKEFQVSIKRLYDLFHFILSSAVSVADYAEERISIGLQKHLPTYAEMRPNRKFVENVFIDLLRRNRPLAHYCKQNSLLWKRDTTSTIRDIYSTMIEREYYKAYMSDPEKDALNRDRVFLKRFFMYEFEDNESLEAMLEERSKWWGSDDLGYVLGAIIRTLDDFQPGQSDDTPLLQAVRSRANKEFAARLLRHSLMHYTEYRNRAMLFVKNWEVDRLATMDVMLIVQGFAEAVEFPEISVKITINEHVELAKYYSTPNSHVFVNGVLDRMVKQGIADGLIVKKALAQEPAGTH